MLPVLDSVSLASAAAAQHMDHVYRYQRYIYDLTRRWFLLGRLDLIENLDPPPRSNVLEVGCGTAWNAIRVARQYPSARVHGFDISTEMLTTAQSSVQRAGLEGRIRLGLADATRFKSHDLFGEEQFDRIYISYALSMIPDWTRVLEQCEVALAPGGELHILDFGNSVRLPAAFRKILFAWLRRFSVTPRADLSDHLASFALSNSLSLDITPLYRDYAAYAVLKRPA